MTRVRLPRLYCARLGLLPLLRPASAYAPSKPENPFARIHPAGPEPAHRQHHEGVSIPCVSAPLR